MKKGMKDDERTNIHDTFNIHEAYEALIYEDLNWPPNGTTHFDIIHILPKKYG